MDGQSLFVLLIQKDGADPHAVRRALGQPAAAPTQLQCVDSLHTALARIGGGGVDVVVLDLSLREEGSNDGLSGFLQLRKAAPQAAVVVLYDARDEGLALRAMRDGAAASALKQSSGDDLALAIRSVVERMCKPTDARASTAPRRTGAAIAFLGAKGGVGTTTVALNVAAALARHRPVMLVEMRPAFGTLQPYLAPRDPIGNLSHLMKGESAEISAAQAAACLWPCKKVPGLSVLFGPQRAEECGELAAGRVQELIQVLTGLADFVVLDLPASLSGANRAAVQAASRVVLVMEREPFCVQSAKRMTGALEAWEGTPQPIEIMVVNRALLSCPMPLAEVETQLGFPPLAVVPPAPEICLAAQRGHVPLVAFQPDSLVAESLNALAEKCASFRLTVPMVA